MQKFKCLLLVSKDWYICFYIMFMAVPLSLALISMKIFKDLKASSLGLKWLISEVLLKGYWEDLDNPQLILKIIEPEQTLLTHLLSMLPFITMFSEYRNKDNIDLSPLSANPTKWSTHSNNSSENCRRIIWGCLTILWDWRLKG